MLQTKIKEQHALGALFTSRVVLVGRHHPDFIHRFKLRNQKQETALITYFITLEF